MTCSVQKNNIGTVFRLTFKDCAAAVIDISTATTKNIIFKSPSGTSATKAGAFVTDGTDGMLDYTTEADFLTEAGTWSVQGHVVIGSQNFKSDISTFNVVDNL